MSTSTQSTHSYHYFPDPTLSSAPGSQTTSNATGAATSTTTSTTTTTPATTTTGTNSTQSAPEIQAQHPHLDPISTTPGTTLGTTTPDGPSKEQRTLEARLAFTASLHSVGANLDSDLRLRAADLHENAAALQSQEDSLRKATADLAKQNDQWEKIADQTRAGLKEIGDVQNWAEMIERDLLIVEETLRLAELGHQGRSKKGKKTANKKKHTAGDDGGEERDGHEAQEDEYANDSDAWSDSLDGENTNHDVQQTSQENEGNSVGEPSVDPDGSAHMNADRINKPESQEKKNNLWRFWW